MRWTRGAGGRAGVAHFQTIVRLASGEVAEGSRKVEGAAVFKGKSGTQNSRGSFQSAASLLREGSGYNSERTQPRPGGQAVKCQANVFALPVLRQETLCFI